MALKNVTIAGGGLAGLALGIGLCQQGVPVTLLEAGSYPRHRVCGEFISGIRPGDLDALGIRDVLGRALRPRQTAWFDGDQLFFRGTLPNAAYGVSRHFLDEALAARFLTCGGVLKTGQRADAHAADEGTVLATGRILQPAGAARPGWLGIKAHYTDLPCTSDLEVHLGKHAYVGVTAVEDGWVNVTGLFREGNGAGGRENLLENAAAAAGLGELAGRLRRARIRAGSLKGVNRFELGWQPGFGRGIRVGDAAAMIAPLTGNGMTMALQGALAAVEPVAGWSRGAWDWQEAECRVVRSQKRLFASRIRWALWLQRAVMHGWGRSLCTTVLRKGWVSFDTLVGLVR